MRWIALVAVVAAACTGQPPGPTPAPSPVPRATAAPEAAPSQLPAAEPAPPSLASFRARATAACTAAAAQLRAAPLEGDPLRQGARAKDVRAAVTHYRARAAAWTDAARDLWEFGLPDHKAAQALVTALDAAGQYSQQTAEFLAAGDIPTAQAAVAAVEEAIADADAAARRMELRPLSDCGRTLHRLPGARRERVEAVDFGFEVGAVGRGPTRFVLRNRGTERHHLAVVRLREPGTLSDAIRADRAGDRPGRFLATPSRVSPEARPGERVTLDITLRRGSYGLLCFVASPDGTPHAYKGMATEISVP